jgi:EmrB/QacA subfamily drug resistance transporter
MLLAAAILVFIMNIDYTAVNLALVPIAEDVGGDLNTLQWLLSIYVLAWGACVIPGGRLADFYGKKPMLMLGIMGFMLGSLVTGMGHNDVILIMGRVLQGIGAALFSAPLYALIFSAVPQHKQGMAMGIMGGAAGLGLAMGPTLAGWIIQIIGWRWIFIINLPLGMLVMAILWRYAPAIEQQTKSERLNWVNASLLAAGLGMLVMALNQVEIWGAGDYRLWGLVAISMTLLTLFWRLDQHALVQMMPRNLLQYKPYLATLILAFCVSYGFAIVMVIMGLYMQNTLKLDSMSTGQMFLSMTLALGVLSVVGGRIVDRLDSRIPTVLGAVILALALVLLGTLNVHADLLRVSAFLFLAGIGLGICFPAMNTLVFRTVPSEAVNVGSAVFTMIVMLGNSISVIISTSLIIIVGHSSLREIIANSGYALTSTQELSLFTMLTQVEHTAAQLSNLSADQIPFWLSAVDQAFVRGMHYAMWSAAVLVVLSAIVCLKYLRKLHCNQQGSNSTPIAI